LDEELFADILKADSRRRKKGGMFRLIGSLLKKKFKPGGITHGMNLPR
jgi:hypothetical protein